MSSSLDFVEYVCAQINEAGNITYRKMFGEYAVYCDGKVIGLICDNQFFLKITPEGKTLLPSGKEAPPYPGAKLYLVIDNLDDRGFLAELVRKTCGALPLPSPKKKK
jgi:TfoX/Sxy family transcriptional regulator of competence genes